MATPIPPNLARFTLSELLDATGGTPSGLVAGAADGVVGIATDTRMLGAGQAFVALRGERFDGHDHLEEAGARGATLVLVERDVVAPAGCLTVRVGSTLAALGALASAHLARWRTGGGRVVAVTGSAGKTTTKRAIAALLEELQPGAVHAAAGNLNNLVGVPMTVLGLEPRHRHAVLELGTNSRGEIATLARMTQPDVGVVTLIAAAHSAGLGSIEDIAVEKCALFDALPARGVAVGNGDDPRVAHRLALDPRRIDYGHGEHVAAQIVSRRLLSLERSVVEVSLRAAAARHSLTFETPLVGRAGALACAGAIAAVVALGEEALQSEVVARAFAGLATHHEGRLETRRLPNGVVLIDDSYNANPASMESSLDAAREIAELTGGRLLLVLGEMRELGSESEAAHRVLGEQVAAAGAFRLVAVGAHAGVTASRAAELGVSVRTVPDAGAAAAELPRELMAGDVVLVKGSRGVHTEQVIQTLAQRGAGSSAGRVRHAGAAP